MGELAILVKKVDELADRHDLSDTDREVATVVARRAYDEVGGDPKSAAKEGIAYVL